MDRKNEIIRYRLDRAYETLSEIDDLVSLGYYHNAINRIYYSCFYAINALFTFSNLSAKSHSGVKHLFSKEFIKKELISKDLGKYFTIMYNKRQTGDYDDFIEVTKEMVEELYEPAKSLIDEIDKFINLEK